MHADDTVWRAHITSSTTTVDGGLELRLAGRAGAPVCGEDCEQVPIRAESLFPAELVVVPRARGVVVPVSALQTTATGDVIVTDAAGQAKPVRIVAEAEGRAVVDGRDWAVAQAVGAQLFPFDAAKPGACAKREQLRGSGRDRTDRPTTYQAWASRALAVRQLESGGHTCGGRAQLHPLAPDAMVVDSA